VTSAPAAADADVRARRASALKERIYVTFTALAVILTLRVHDAHPTTSAALRTLAVAVTSTVCAVYIADLLSHMVVHARVPGRPEHNRIVASTLGAGAAALPPLACIALSGTGVYGTSTGLLAATSITVVTLMAIGVMAVRELDVPRHHRIVILAGETLMAVVVLALGLLAHR
jgi:hypothetical protein